MSGAINHFWIFPSNSKNTLIRLLSMAFCIINLAIPLKYKKIIASDWVIIQNSPLLVSFSGIILFKYLFKKIALNVSDLYTICIRIGCNKERVLYAFLEKLKDLIILIQINFGAVKRNLDYVNSICTKPQFLYRNIQPESFSNYSDSTTRLKKVKLVYAGLLGVAQGIRFNQ